MSKPTWSNTFGCSTTSAFFVLVGDRGADRRLFHKKVQRNVNNPMAAFGYGVAGDEATAEGNGAVVTPCRDERQAPVAVGLERWFGQRGHLDEPLLRQAGFDDGVAPVAVPDRMPVWLDFFEQAGLLELGYDPSPGFEPIQAAEA